MQHAVRYRPELGYRPELDGLRAIAVVLVIVFHALQPRRFSGFIGVDVFFALSGYLITTILLRELDERQTLRLGRFYRRRFLRLYPALLFMVVCSFTFATVLSGSFSYHVKNAVIACTYTANLYMTYDHNWIQGFGHTWSLALEEQYYLLWPVVLLLSIRLHLSRRWIAVLITALAIVTTYFSVEDFRFGTISEPLQSTSTGLLLGSAAALVLDDRYLRRAFAAPVIGLFGAALVLAELATFSVTSSIAAGWYAPVAALGTICVIAYLTVAEPGRVQHLLAAAPLVGIGRISYGIYLWHYPVLLVLERKTSLSSGMLLVIDLVSAVAVAALSYRYVETPFLRLKDKRSRPTMTESSAAAL